MNQGSVGLVRTLKTALLPLLVVIGGPVYAACPSDPEVTLATSLHAASAAYQAMDLDTFTAQRMEANRSIACLEVVVAREEAAAYHRLEALDAYLARDADRAFHDFRAARYAHWEFELPKSIAPPGNPLYEAWVDAASYPVPKHPEAELPRKTALLIDGREKPGRPEEIAAVVQLVHDDGRILYSRYLRANAPEPDWGRAGKKKTAKADPDPKRTTREPSAAVARTGTGEMKVKTGGRPPRTRDPIQVSVPLVAGGSALLATSAVLYFAASQSRASFDHLNTSFEDLDGLQTRTNSLVVASGSTAAVGVGLTAASFVVKW